MPDAGVDKADAAAVMADVDVAAVIWTAWWSLAFICVPVLALAGR
ncbi:MAG TPA: hypothetical protein VF221_17690 [Chloroflexota bacterium]